MQKLILPINKAKLTASIDTEAYKNRFGFRHYGADMVATNGSLTVYSSGNGTVVAAGYDNACGNVVAVYYPGCYNHRAQKTHDVILRYFHLGSISVRSGQKVNKDTRLGYYGHTGKYAGTGAHLHLEADSDTKYPLYTPTLSASNFLRGVSQGAIPYDSPGNTVINPLDMLHIKPNLPDWQGFTTAGDRYIRTSDRYLPGYR
jgi:murein DD-endopeptidase MepM/ murein hydrolase activator NlpD